MKRCNDLGTLVLVTALALFGAACGERQPDEALPELPDAAVLFESINAHVERGETGEALTLLRRAVTELPDGIEKKNAFAFKINLLLREGRIEDAQDVYIDALTAEPACAEYAHGMIEQYLEFDDDQTALLGWARRVLRAEPPSALRPAYLQIELRLLQRDAGIGKVTETLDRYVADVEPAILAPVTLTLAETLLQDGAKDDAEQLHQWLVAAEVRDEAYDRASRLMEMELLMANGRWERFTETAQRALVMLDDRDAATRFERWLRGAMRARQEDAADRLAAQTLTRHETFPAAAARAARWYLAIPWERGDRDASLNRFQGLAMGGGLPPQHLAPLVGWMADVIFNEGTVEQSVRFLELSDTLPWSRMAEDTRGRLIGLLLDISFNAADYDRSIALLDEGLPQYDPAWHEIMRNKVLAHKAEDAGDTAEAVRRFRVFMEHIAAEQEAGDKEELVDPISGHRMTHSMIMALNARRIGDIYSRADHLEEAQAAYTEAAGYYREAIEEVGKASPEGVWIRTQLDEMGATDHTNVGGGS